MLETANSRIDIRELEQRIRWDAQRYNFVWHGTECYLPPGGRPEQQTTSATEAIAAASALANVESPHYTLQRYPAFVRWLPRIVAKSVLYVSRVITHPQTHFNLQVIKGLENLIEKIEDLDQRLDMVEQRLFQTEERSFRADGERFDHGQELESIRSRLPGLESELPVMRDNLANQVARLSAQERLLDQLGRAPVAGSPLPATGDVEQQVQASPGALGGLYTVFEARFRGSPEEVRERQAEYLPVVKDSLDGSEAERPFIDLGCGRGEWLELLGENGIQALGVDTNPGLLAQCEDSGLEVVECDALGYLASLADGSVSGVTGFHIIEHLEFDLLVRLVDEIRRVLVDGGVVIFETPNPKNLIVGACNFYADPTHVRQVFPELLEFLMQSRGFHSVSLRFLNPHPQEQQLSTEEAPVLAEQLNNLLSCARDFAVIAYK
jgi:O-antigen chain-terminating methyltransferase